jgi:hypothetical protein
LSPRLLIRSSFGFAAGGELPRDQAEPGREITTSAETLPSPDCGDKRRRDKRADPGDGRQSAGLFVLFRPAHEFGVEGRDPPVEFGPLRASVGDEQDRPRAQSRSSLFVRQHGQELHKLPLALRGHQSALEQNGAQLIDQSRPLADQAVPENGEASARRVDPGSSVRRSAS